MKPKKKRERGITLIALVITIIVLLMLAGITIATLTGDNGILTKANEAKEQTEESKILETIKLEVMDSIDNTGNINIEKLNINLKNNVKNLLYNGNPLSEENSIIELPIVIEVNGYDIKILKDGNIEKGKYIELECLESTGTQYIDTEVKADYSGVKQKWKVEALMSRTADKSSYAGSGINCGGYIGFWDNKRCIGSDSGAYENGVFPINKYSLFKHEFIVQGNLGDSSVVYFDDKGPFSRTTANMKGYGSSSYYIYAVGHKQGNREYADLFMIGGIKYYKIYVNDELVRDYIPVLDKQGIPALYDKVQQKYYYNQGTGEFLYKK